MIPLDGWPGQGLSFETPYTYTINGGVFRLVIGFYCLATLDILGAIETATSEGEREEWRNWVWAQQVGMFIEIFLEIFYHSVGSFQLAYGAQVFEGRLMHINRRHRCVFYSTTILSHLQGRMDALTGIRPSVPYNDLCGPTGPSYPSRSAHTP